MNYIIEISSNKFSVVKNPKSDTEIDNTKPSNFNSEYLASFLKDFTKTLKLINKEDKVAVKERVAGYVNFFIRLIAFCYKHQPKLSKEEKSAIKQTLSVIKTISDNKILSDKLLDIEEKLFN